MGVNVQDQPTQSVWTLSDTNLAPDSPDVKPRRSGHVHSAAISGMPHERILALAEYVSPPDRALLRAVYDQGRTLVELAPLMGVEPRSIGRRVRRLLFRLGQPAFALAALHAAGWIAEGGQWRDLGRVARACVLEGQTLRAAARSLGMSIHAVRRHRETVLAMAQGARVLGVVSRGSLGITGPAERPEGGASWRGKRSSSESSIDTPKVPLRERGSSAPWRRSG